MNVGIFHLRKFFLQRENGEWRYQKRLFSSIYIYTYTYTYIYIHIHIHICAQQKMFFNNFFLKSHIIIATALKKIYIYIYIYIYTAHLAGTNILINSYLHINIYIWGPPQRKLRILIEWFTKRKHTNQKVLVMVKISDTPLYLARRNP